MANQLGMAERHSILVLARRGWSHRRIARELGIHRETVARYLGLTPAEPVRAHPPPEAPAKPAISITGSGEPVATSADSITAPPNAHQGHAWGPSKGYGAPVKASMSAAMSLKSMGRVGFGRFG